MSVVSRYAMWRPKNSRAVSDQFPYDSIKYKTFNNVIDTICCVAFKHAFVHQVDYGDIWEVNLEKDVLFPYFHCVPQTVETDVSTLKYNFQLIIMDLVEPDKSNEQQVQSDTLQILLDIISLFRNGDITKSSADEIPTYYAEGEYTLTPFTERFDNAVTGWMIDFAVHVDNPFPACNVPLKDSDSCID
jgi:hypothetical protein